MLFVWYFQDQVLIKNNHCLFMSKLRFFRIKYKFNYLLFMKEINGFKMIWKWSYTVFWQKYIYIYVSTRKLIHIVSFFFKYESNHETFVCILLFCWLNCNEKWRDFNTQKWTYPCCWSSTKADFPGAFPVAPWSMYLGLK